MARALAGRAEVCLNETPLDEFAEWLRQKHKINVAIDQRALKAQGLTSDRRLSIQVKRVTLSEALHLALQPHELAYVVRGEALLITTQEELKRQLRSAVYDVRDLLRSRGTDPAKANAADSDWLVELIKTSVGPTTWDDVGGEGTLRPFNSVLVVWQTDAVHEEVADLLRLLRNICVLKRAEDPAETLLAAALEKRISLELDKMPLAEAVLKLAAAADIDGVVDRGALERGGKRPDAPVALHVRDTTLKAALGALLQPAGLLWSRRHGAIVVTTQEEASANLRTALYDVRELVSEGEKLQPGDEYDYTEVVDLLLQSVSPSTWDEQGGPGSLAPFQGFLVVSQGEGPHDEIAAFLEHLRDAVRGKRPMASDRPLVRVLARPVTLSFHATPLDDALTELGKKAGCRIVINGQNMDKARLKSPLTLSLSGVPLETALDLCVQSGQMAWYADEEEAVVTTVENANERTVLRWYDLAGVLPSENERREAAERLATLIRQTVTPASWQEVGGPGSVFMFRGMMAVSQTEKAHRQIAQLLADLRKVQERGEKR